MRALRFIGDPNMMNSLYGIRLHTQAVYHHSCTIKSANGGSATVLEMQKLHPDQWEVAQPLSDEDREFMKQVAIEAMKDWDGPAHQHSEIGKFCAERMIAVWRAVMDRLEED